MNQPRSPAPFGGEEGEPGPHSDGRAQIAQLISGSGPRFLMSLTALFSLYI